MTARRTGLDRAGTLPARCHGDIPRGQHCPVVIAVRASWPDERIIRCRLDALHRTVKAERIRRTALILVGPVLGAADHGDSKLYDAEHFHLLRSKKKRRPAG